MEIGKVPENVLKRAVFKQIRHRREEVILHPGVGKSIRYTLSLTNDAATIGWDVTDVDKWADEDNQEKDPVAPAV